MKTTRARITIGLALLALGCGSRTVHAPATSLIHVEPTGLPADAPESRDHYRLKSGDRLSIRVLADAAFNSTAEIQMDGRVAIPWVGSIQASGREIGELEAEVEDSLRTFLRFPEVTLGIDAFGASRVYVTGAVAVPGAYPIEAGQTVLGAIAAAGGLLTTANSRDVLLLRRTSETEATVHGINVKDVLKGADTFADPIVQHLDIVHVPRTLIADIGIFVNQFFSQIAPVFSFYLAGWEAFNVSEVRVVNASRFVP